MPNYSPAPWALITTEDGDEKVLQGDAYEIFIGNLEDTCEICYGNAFLIEQAPLMYELLREMRQDIILSTDFDERIDKIVKRVQNGQ